MKNLQSAFMTLLFAAFFFAFAAQAQAQATRTWVSGVGDDVNPCSRTAPCKTFAGAISKTAKGGEINCLDAGGFGAVTITKSITLSCTGETGFILASLTTGIVINISDSADAAAVRIRGLSINGAGNGLDGIRIIAAAKVSIENTVIDGFKSGILAASTRPAQIFIKDSSIRNNSDTGINAAAGNQIAISNVSVIFNGTGLANATGGTIVSYKNNHLFGNKKDGAPTSTVALQ